MRMGWGLPPRQLGIVVGGRGARGRVRVILIITLGCTCDKSRDQYKVFSRRASTRRQRLFKRRSLHV